MPVMLHYFMRQLFFDWVWQFLKVAMLPGSFSMQKKNKKPVT